MSMLNTVSVLVSLLYIDCWLSSAYTEQFKIVLPTNNVAKNIKQGKNIILNNLESNISNTFSNQYKAIENTNKYILNWRNYFENKDFSGMEKEYNKIEKQLKNIAPIESTIKNARTIEVLHNLIKNNGQDFNLTKEQLELAEKLA